MLKEERYEQILKILDEETYISATMLSERLYVSLPTIRRDLAELQKRGMILRSHGGAKKIQADSIVAPLNFRKTVNSTNKRQLCKIAAQLINDNDIIFVDSSTTTLQIADFIVLKNNVTVITNGITLASLLAAKGVKTLCTGGEIFENSLANFGSFAEDFIRRFNIDITFFSCYGINEKGMLTDPSLPETQIRRIAINQSQKNVFLCDRSKLSLSAPYNLTHIQNIDYIVTNAPEIESYIDTENKHKIILVPNKQTNNKD